jgi:hypothetical protein
MTQPDQLLSHHEYPARKPLWPLAAVILGVVFTPALLAFVLTLLRH